jgi:hypothetical protein
MAAVLVGQVWTYRTRPGEEQSRVQVLVVEDVPGVGEVVHVSVDGVRIPNPVHPDRFSTAIGHVPITREAFDRSVLDVVETVAGDPDLENYQVWRDEGGGVFTHSLSDIVTFVESALRGGPEGH